MYSVECILIKSEYIEDEIGKETEVKTETLIPIIKVLPVTQKEFYEANFQGIKPSLKILISTINFNNENELIYQGTLYSIIRTYNKNYDEMELICQRKVGDIIEES